MPQPHHRLPSMSHRMPSGVPGPASMNTRLFEILSPLAETSWARIFRFGTPRDSTTYRIFSSGEKHRPLGPSTPSATILDFPVLPSTRYTLASISDSAFEPS